LIDGLLEGIKDLPQSALDSFREGGNAIGERAAVALEPELAAKLNEIYGLDVSIAQQALLLVRTISAVSLAGWIGALLMAGGYLANNDRFKKAAVWTSVVSVASHGFFLIVGLVWNALSE